MTTSLRELAAKNALKESLQADVPSPQPVGQEDITMLERETFMLQDKAQQPRDDLVSSIPPERLTVAPDTPESATVFCASPGDARLILLSLRILLEKHIHHRDRLLALQPALDALTTSLTHLYKQGIAKKHVNGCMGHLSHLGKHFTALEAAMADASPSTPKTWLAAVQASISTFPEPSDNALDMSEFTEQHIPASTQDLLSARPAILAALNEATCRLTPWLVNHLKPLDDGVQKLGKMAAGTDELGKAQLKQSGKMQGVGVEGVVKAWSAAFNPVWVELGGSW